MRVQLYQENKWSRALKSRLFWHQMFLKSFTIIGPFILAAADPSQHPTSSSCGIMICWYDWQYCWSMFNSGISCLSIIFGHSEVSIPWHHFLWWRSAQVLHRQNWTWQKNHPIYSHASGVSIMSRGWTLKTLVPWLFLKRQHPVKEYDLFFKLSLHLLDRLVQHVFAYIHCPNVCLTTPAGWLLFSDLSC